MHFCKLQKKENVTFLLFSLGQLEDYVFLSLDFQLSKETIHCRCVTIHICMYTYVTGSKVTKEIW